MSQTEFDDALAAALDGWIVTDLGADAELEAALTKIAQAAPRVPRELIDSARDAFRRNGQR